MTYDEIEVLVKKNFKTSRPADIAKELGVTPQVVNNWKSRNQVPYKYVKKIRAKIKNINSVDLKSINNPFTLPNPSYGSQADGSVAQLIITVISKTKQNLVLCLSLLIFFLFLAILYNTFAERVYVSKVNILPVSSEGGSSVIPSLAKQFGLNNGDQGAAGLHSTIMYPDILKSKRLASLVLKHKFATKKYDEPKSLISILLKIDDKENNWTDNQLRLATKLLVRKINVKKNRGSAQITMSVSAFERQLAVDLAQKILEEFESLLYAFKIEDIIEKRDYIENRIIGIQKDLSHAEENLKNFREENRSIFTSPLLTLNEDRLVREVSVQEQIFITLKSQYEMVQIELLGQKKMMQILDPPSMPGRMSKPNKSRNIVTALAISLILAYGYIFCKEWYAENKNELKVS